MKQCYTQLSISNKNQPTAQRTPELWTRGNKNPTTTRKARWLLLTGGAAAVTPRAIAATPAAAAAAVRSTTLSATAGAAEVWGTAVSPATTTAV